MADAAVPPLSLENFGVSDSNARISSPRSLQACKNEGVLPAELIYKPIEAFHEGRLSPRLVKLRFDFFEAKRRDLLAACTRARKSLVAEERREAESGNSQQIEAIAKMNGLTKNAVLALQSDGLKLERQKLLRAQEHGRNWLKNALRNELNQLATLEAHNTALTADSDDYERKCAEGSRRAKELNDSRKLEEDRKQAELLARMKLEKQIAKEEFAKQQEEAVQKGKLEMQRQQELYQKQLQQMEEKKEAEREKERKRQEEFDRQVARKEEMRAQDLKRTDLMVQQRELADIEIQKKRDKKDARIIASVEVNQEKERQRRLDFEVKMANDEQREHKLMQIKAVEQEEMAKRSFQLMMRRKHIQEESSRKAVERKLAITEQHEDMEMRLLEHEQKKERYLDFKKELDDLRGHNKNVNVTRQRRREEAVREGHARLVQRKDEKMEWMASERARLHQIRRATQSETYRCREIIKNEIMRQRVSSKYSSAELQKKIGGLMGNELFSPKILGGSTSLPAIPSASQ